MEPLPGRAPTPDRGVPRGDAIRFVLDGEVVALRDVDPTRTVLQYLREDLRRTGTKEGCAEGDCGACTVVVAEPDRDGDRLRFRAVNACIQFLPTLDGKELLTVESLAGPGGDLHPVQRALVDCHGSQCGFCTPGFVMSLFALYKTRERPTRREIDDALAGNLCRCTGYRPIVAAAERMYDYADEVAGADRNWMSCSFSSPGVGAPPPGEAETLDLLRSLARRGTLEIAHGTRRYFAPTTLAALAALREAHPDACVLAGGTDVGLWVTKQHRDLDTIIYVGGVPELARIDTTGSHVDIGAAATLTDATPALLTHYPDLEELLVRFASPPIRNAGTLGGNVANGSPIGDSMPALIAIGATVVLRKGEATREIALEDLYVAYGVTALAAGEFVERLRVPIPAATDRVRSYKLSKRFDQDISAVCGAYRVSLDGDRVGEARVAYGGMAATPKRAAACEAALVGREWSEATVESAMAALDRDFEPIGDMRASAAYRRQAAKNLLYRFWLEASGRESTTRLYDYARPA